MRALTNLKPAQGFSHYFHLGLTSFLPAVIFVLIRMGFAQVAVILILLSKWRMFVVRPRYWMANLAANAVDIIVGLSIVVFMDHTSSALMQLIWAALYGFWLVFIKPGSNLFMVSTQALIGQALGLVALYVAWLQAPMLGIVFATWVVTYLSARHFFTSFEDQYTPLFAHGWAYFAAALTWVLSHWLLFYGAIPQPALLLTVIGSSLGGMFYLSETDRLGSKMRMQFMFIMFAVVLIVIVLSDWGDKTV
jgi:hypothetical protein